MGIEYIIIALIAFMVIAALIAAETADLLSCVIAVGAAGFALSVIDLLLGAPDLAITQVAVEIIALVLLVRVVLTRRDESLTQPRDALRTGIVLLAGGLLLVVGFLAVGGFGTEQGTIPPFGAPLMSDPQNAPVRPVASDYLTKAADETGAANSVTAVLLDYRAYDTLGEATVIFVSILGVYAVIRRVGRIRKEPRSGSAGKGAPPQES
jgi:multisubunit Na+/H+ antiporter MnhB subunit